MDLVAPRRMHSQPVGMHSQPSGCCCGGQEWWSEGGVNTELHLHRICPDCSSFGLPPGESSRVEGFLHLQTAGFRRGVCCSLAGGADINCWVLYQTSEQGGAGELRGMVSGNLWPVSDF